MPFCTATSPQESMPSSMTMWRSPEMMPSRRCGLLGRATSSTVPPHSMKSCCEIPCAFSSALMAKSTQSLAAMDTFIFGRFAINSSIVRTASLGETAMTRRSHEGNTARARSG